MREDRTRPDSELVARALDGDRDAVGELYSRYWRAARAAAFGVTHDLAAAEDAASEAFRDALAALSSLRDPDCFGAWLHRIVLRKARRGLAARIPSTETVSGPEAAEASPESALERLELEQQLVRAIGRLPNRLREAIALFYFEGYDTEAAARFLGTPHGTLRRRLHEGRERLRRELTHSKGGISSMDPEREQRLKEMLEGPDAYRSIREALRERPVPDTLLAALQERRRSEIDPKAADALARRWLGPSPDALDPDHPLGKVAAVIRQNLEDFDDWQPEPGSPAATPALPPGFAEGRPGAFVRRTRGIVRSGPDRGGLWALLEESPDVEAFGRGAAKLALSDVLDLTWITGAPLEMRAIQEMLERLVTSVLGAVRPRFEPHDEPRFRSALRLALGEIDRTAAHGGVLNPWPGGPKGADAAYVRIFLEPWASVSSGTVIAFSPLPEGRKALGEACPGV